MKKITTILVFALVFFTNNSCSKSDDAAIIDCVGEGIVTELKHSVDPANAYKINYSIEYGGSNTVSSVNWTFGDGKSETTTGKTVSHTYATAGTFEVKADVSIAKSGGSCTVSPKKSITIN